VTIETIQTGQTEQEILEAFKGLVEASRALDARRYFDYVDSDRFTGLSADGQVWHCVKDLEDVIFPGFRAVEKIVDLQFYRIKVTVINPATAILVNEYTQTILLKNQDVIEQSGGGTQVWAKSGAAWKLVSISASDSSQRNNAVF